MHSLLADVCLNGRARPHQVARVEQQGVLVVAPVAEHSRMLEQAAIDDLGRRQHLAERRDRTELEDGKLSLHLLLAGEAKLLPGLGL